MKVRIAQLVVSKDIIFNVGEVISTLQESTPSEWILFPEGMISGYYPEESTFLSQLGPNIIEQSINNIEKVVHEKKVNCLIGSAMKLNDEWYNCTIFISPDTKIIYRKLNLSTLDRNHFASGNELGVYEADQVTFGIQMCRELAFPEQWKLLKKNGAQVIFHINNSIKESDQLRESVLVARAFENQIWICSVNNAASPQAMRSMIIDPLGNIVWQSTPQKEEIHTKELDLSLDSDQYLQQERSDLVEVIAK